MVTEEDFFARLRGVMNKGWYQIPDYPGYRGTDMDLSWNRIRWLTTKLEEALRETREARDKAEDQIRCLAGQNQRLQDMLFKERARRDYD